MFDPEDVPFPSETLTYEDEAIRRLFFHLTMASALVQQPEGSPNLPKAVLNAERALAFFLKVRRSSLAQERYPGEAYVPVFQR